MGMERAGCCLFSTICEEADCLRAAPQNLLGRPGSIGDMEWSDDPQMLDLLSQLGLMATQSSSPSDQSNQTVPSALQDASPRSMDL
eukprot:CAMPEP_0114563228 /NCGR_PEP_ID=MMETSP0114-20121206/12986_1 /TAXON_ID=31324 /ORGANISM="Goniomonas sp, Strain m" /LENGTH=85 /DNA_ID=CAMNT_0001749037 /DNA_START=364 /DNA_END=617 /DNA_ORIENTATION=+